MESKAADEIKCSICLEHNIKIQDLGNKQTLIKCPKCGDLILQNGAKSVIYEFLRCSVNDFQYKDSIEKCADYSESENYLNEYPLLLGEINSDERVTASSYIRNYGPSISSHQLHQLGAVTKPNAMTRVSQFMKELINCSDDIGSTVPVFPTTDLDPKWLSVMWCKDWENAQAIVNFCNQQGWYTGAFKSDGGLGGNTLFPGYVTLNGWHEFGSSRHSKNIFIARWFHDSMSIAGDKVKDAISENGFIPRITLDIEHVNKIDDQIIVEINNSIAIVADFTGHRGGVYFEAGYAMGLGIPVIWTCRSDDVEKLHFDIRQYNCIDWKNEDELKEKLTHRIASLNL